MYVKDLEFELGASRDDILAEAMALIRPTALLKAFFKGSPIGRVVSTSDGAIEVEQECAYGLGYYRLAVEEHGPRRCTVRLTHLGITSTSSPGFGRGIRDGDVRRYTQSKMNALADRLKKNWR